MGEQLEVLEDMLDLMAKVVSVPGAAPSVIDTGAGVQASVSNDFWPHCGLCCELKFQLWNMKIPSSDRGSFCSNVKDKCIHPILVTFF